MSERSRLPKWIWWALAALILAIPLSTMLRFGPPRDPLQRPIGTADDIEGLRSRTNVNVLFVLVDTLRADRLGAYGYERDTSPALDRIASEGVRFDRHLAQSSWTKCSMASLWSGLNPSRTGVTRFDDVVPEQARMPAEILREGGFQTVGIYRNGWVSSTFGFAQGFDVYQRPMGSGLPQHVKRQNPTLSEQGTDEDVVSAALEFLRINGRDRWFLYLHMMDVHEYLYDEQSALFGTTYSDVYDNSIRWTDGIIELLFQHLGAAGYLENTIIVITSDHGEAFQERGFEGHARKVFRETTEVPFIISLPFRLDPGVVVDSRTRGIDVWPTLLDLIGLETAADLDGRSLLPLLLSRARGSEVKEPAPTGIAHLDQDWGQRNRPARPTVAVTDGSLRYVRVDQGQRSIEQLFDRAQDPAELEDLSEHEQETVERLRAIAGDYLEQPPAWGKVPTKELDELELNHLRALGYALP